MTALNHSTRRRLRKLPQIPSVWEGDRRVLPAAVSQRLPLDIEGHKECVLWVDGTQGAVRSMDVVPLDAGPEAVVRTLLQAMEYPQGAAKPARPQKIVVCDRELQFFLRGVLQELEINIDYAAELPLIEDIFRGLQEVMEVSPPELPAQFAQPLIQKAFELWNAAPWELLSDHQVIAIELNHWDIETLYASIMGFLGMEYGVLLYRSINSLRQFREQLLEDEESLENMEAAFLRQDCLFLTFEAVTETEEEEDEDFDLATLPIEEIKPSFGNLHPLEGMRAFLYEEEAIAMWVALEALDRFFRQHRNEFVGEAFPPLQNRYQISLPPGAEAAGSPRSVKVETLPDLANELLELGESAEADLDLPTLLGLSSLPRLRDDLVPVDAYLSLGMLPWETVESLRTSAKFHQPGSVTPAGDGLPILLIQTSQPKAKGLIDALQAAGGVRAIYFNPGEDSLSGERYDLGILQTEDGDFHLLSEFLEEDPVHIQARKKWNQRAKKTQGWCGLLIARGLKGASRGNPQLKDMQALFEVRFGTAEDLGMGTLHLLPQLDD